MDAEYKAMKRRMSRVRVNCGKGASLEAEDASYSEDGGYKDLIKFWKKHGIPIPKDLISTMADESVKLAKAKGQGRRRSRELEDLHLCASTGKFNLENLEQLKEQEEDTDKRSVRRLTTAKVQAAKKPLIRRQTDSQLVASRGAPLKKAGSKLSTNSVSSPGPLKKPASRSLSLSKLK